MTDITGIEYATTFDQRPTHRFAPAEVTEAGDNMMAAWEDELALIDLREEGGDITPDEIFAAAERAAELEVIYRKLYQEWDDQRGRELYENHERLEDGRHVMTEEGQP